MRGELSIRQRLGPISPLGFLRQGLSRPPLPQMVSGCLRSLNGLQKTEKGSKSEQGKREEEVNAFQVELTKLRLSVYQNLYFFGPRNLSQGTALEFVEKKIFEFVYRFTHKVVHGGAVYNSKTCKQPKWPMIGKG